MSLFGDLPAPANENKNEKKKKKKSEEEEDGVENGGRKRTWDTEDSGDLQPVRKTQVTQASHVHAAAVDDAAGRKGKKGVRFRDEDLSGVIVPEALDRIFKHISKRKKCYKCCELVLKLLQGGHLNSETSHLFFRVLKEAVTRDLSLSAQPELRRIFRKLFLTAEGNVERFSKVEQAWIKEFSLVAIVRNELFTDDSFLFNKRLNFVKKQFVELEVGGGDPDGDEASALFSFHLEALVECFEAAKDVYQAHPWTQSGTDLLARVAFDKAACFKFKAARGDDLHARVLECYRWIENAKNERKRQSGRTGSSDGKVGDSSFDASIKQWEKKQGISKRSTQGGGDSWRNSGSSLLG